MGKGGDMPRGKRVQDLTTIQMALVGYEVERQKIDDKIRELRALLKSKRVDMPSAGVEKSTPRGRRNLSAAARRRISLAQKRRWAQHRTRKGQAAKTA
jgi:hypothetical protein